MGRTLLFIVLGFLLVGGQIAWPAAPRGNAPVAEGRGVEPAAPRQNALVIEGRDAGPAVPPPSTPASTDCCGPQATCCDASGTCAGSASTCSAVAEADGADAEADGAGAAPCLRALGCDGAARGMTAPVHDPIVPAAVVALAFQSPRVSSVSSCDPSLEETFHTPPVPPPEQNARLA